MAGVFATSAFAATDGQMADAREYLAKKQISYDISEDEVDLILEKFNNSQADAEAAGDALIARVKADPNNAKTIIKETLAGYGITDVVIDDFTLSADGTISGKGSINGKAVSATIAGDVVSDHPEIADNKDENGNWHVNEETTEAASSVANAGVIKATGDNSAVVLVAGVLAVATVLGLAVRKNSNIG